MIPFLDVAGYQYAGFRQTAVGNEGFTFYLPPNTPPPNLEMAKANKVQGVISRAVNATDIDPSYPLTVEACRDTGLVAGLYAYLRPTYSTPQAAADAMLHAFVDSSIGIDIVMADCEAMLLDPAQSVAVESQWKGRRYADWLHEWLAAVQAGTGCQPLIYTGKWWWDRVLADCGQEFAPYDFVLANYPHQPKAMPQQQWPTVPLPADWWHAWATTEQGGDPGMDEPLVVAGVPTWAGWQFSSWAKANDYGFNSGGRLDCNIAKDDAWERWTFNETDWQAIARDLYGQLRKVEALMTSESTSAAMEAYDDAVSWESSNE
jgi:GH25 family lysozyme M1 (1,4-beta-N-acetylmuramidase)